MFGLFGASKKDILEEGRQAMATIRDVHDTGTRINNRPRIKLTLEIQPMGQPSWTVEKKMTVQDGDLPQVGAQLPVRFLPEDRDRVEIDERAVAMTEAQIVTSEGTVPAQAPRAPEPPPPPEAPPVPAVPPTPQPSAQPFGGQVGAFGSLQDAIAAAQAAGQVQWTQGGQVIDARNVEGLREAMMQALKQYGISVPDAAMGNTMPANFSAGMPTPASEAPAAADDDGDPVAKLEKLAELKKQGVLTDAEFSAAKAKLLGEL